jgi:hypothetical protein
VKRGVGGVGPGFVGNPNIDPGFEF